MHKPHKVTGWDVKYLLQMYTQASTFDVAGRRIYVHVYTTHKEEETTGRKLRRLCVALC